VKGDEDGLHIVHWHGNLAFADGRGTDSVVVTPGGTRSTDMTVDVHGKWIWHCHVSTILNLTTFVQILPPKKTGVDGYLQFIFLSVPPISVFVCTSICACDMLVHYKGLASCTFSPPPLPPPPTPLSYS
jgi:hypothetical protein